MWYANGTDQSELLKPGDHQEFERMLTERLAMGWMVRVSGPDGVQLELSKQPRFITLVVLAVGLPLLLTGESALGLMLVLLVWFDFTFTRPKRAFLLRPHA